MPELDEFAVTGWGTNPTDYYDQWAQEYAKLVSQQQPVVVVAGAPAEPQPAPAPTPPRPRRSKPPPRRTRPVRPRSPPTPRQLPPSFPRPRPGDPLLPRAAPALLRGLGRLFAFLWPMPSGPPGTGDLPDEAITERPPDADVPVPFAPNDTNDNDEQDDLDEFVVSPPGVTYGPVADPPSLGDYPRSGYVPTPLSPPGVGPVDYPVESPDPTATYSPLPLPPELAAPDLFSSPLPNPRAVPVPDAPFAPTIDEFPFPLDNPVGDRRPSAPPGIPLNLDPFSPLLPADKPTTNADSCDCNKNKRKKRQKRDPRSVCWKGTYIQRARGISYTRREQVPCEGSTRVPKSVKASILSAVEQGREIRVDDNPWDFWSEAIKGVARKAGKMVRQNKKRAAKARAAARRKAAREKHAQVDKRRAARARSRAERDRAKIRELKSKLKQSKSKSKPKRRS